MSQAPSCAAVDWEVDRQVVLMHVQNLLLALRSSTKFSSKIRFTDVGPQRAEHPFMQMMLSLQRRVLSATSCVSGTEAAMSLTSTLESPISSNVGGPDATAHIADQPFSVSGSPSSSNHLVAVSESEILRAFCTVCLSPLTSETITCVSLSALIAVAELPCSFLSVSGLCMIIEAGMNSRSEATSYNFHEVMLVRVMRLFVMALEHSAAALIPEDTYIRVISRMLVISLHPDASSLLRHSAEAAMKAVITILYRRVASPANITAHTPSSPRQTTEGPDGTAVLQFIGSLISGEVVALDEGGSPVVLSPTDANSNGQRSSAPAVMADSPEEVAAIQLEGLWLAQYALQTVQYHLAEPHLHPLLETVQHGLSRALLVAGVKTTQIVVLSQILRTVHLVVQFASHHLVRQIFSFLRVLHLNPIASLTEELRAVEGGASTMVTPQSPILNGSPFEKSRSYLTRAQILELHERRELLLDSLAEFCSDPHFAAFCYAHYDLSMRWAPMVPQLCDVLLTLAHGFYSLDKRGNGTGGRPASIALASTGSVGGNDGMGLSQIQITALDAIANMAASMALRGSDNSDILDTSNSATDGASGCHHTPSVLSRGTITSTIDEVIRQKKMLMEFAMLFKESPLKKGVSFLLEKAIRVPKGQEQETISTHKTWLVIAEPGGGAEVGECLFRLNVLLNKRVLGDYIGELGREEMSKPSLHSVPTEVSSNGSGLSAEEQLAGMVETWERSRLHDHLKPGTVRFFEEQLKGFVHQFNFAGKSLLTSIREMVYSLCLPGESQKIDRVMETFAKHWVDQNAASKGTSMNPFRSETGAFVLSFAIILLNTDLHSGRMQKHMAFEDFRRMNSKADAGGSIPEDYLREVYDDVKQHEIIMAEMMDRGFSNNVTWDLEMGGVSSNTESLSLSSYADSSFAPITLGSVGTAGPLSSLAGPTAVLLRAIDPYVFRAVWKQCLIAFTGVIDIAAAVVSRVSIQGTGSLEGAAAAAHLKVPLELAGLRGGLRGVSVLACAAAGMQLSEVSDQCMQTLTSLLSFVDIRNPAASVSGVVTNLASLLTIREVFSLASSVWQHLSDSWEPLATLFVNLYLLGMLSVANKDEGEGQDAPAEGDAMVSLPSVLSQDPGIVQLMAHAKSKGETASSVGSGAGGWLAALWGGGTAAAAAEDEKARRAEERCQGVRLRGCVGDMRSFLRWTQTVTGAARVRMVHALCDATQGPNGSAAAVATASPASLGGGPLLASYSVHVLCAVVSQIPVADAAAGGSGSDDDSTVASLFAACMQSHLLPVLQATDRQLSVTPSHDRGSSSPPPTTATSTNTQSTLIAIGQRMMGTLVGVLRRQLLDLRRWDTKPDSLCEKAVTLLTHNIPPRAFTAVVAPDFSSVLFDALLQFWQENHEGTSKAGATQGPSREVNAILRMVFEVVRQLDVPLASGETLRCLRTVLHHTAKYCMYDVAALTESILNAILTLSLSGSGSPPDMGVNSARVRSEGTMEGRDTATADDNAVTASTTLQDGSAADILGYCSRNVVNAGQEAAAASRVEDWIVLWVLSLKSLCALITCATSTKDGTEGVFNLQRSLLDTGIHDLPAHAITAVYDEVLFPLVDRLTAPLVATQGAASPPAVPAAAVPTEVKSRVLSLLPKALLQYSPAFGADPEAHQALWQRVLGTLYAVYTSYTASDEVASAPAGGSATMAAEEAAQVREAVEETVKNMVYVVAATLTDTTAAPPAAMLQRAPCFWVSTRNLVRPFDFSGPLLTFMESLSASGPAV